MENLPHKYSVQSNSKPDSLVSLESKGLNNISIDAPGEFGGSGKYWSPETMFVASVATCFILTFKAVSRASKLEWLELSCDVDGTLDKDDKKTRFTKLVIKPVLTASKGIDKDRAIRVLEKAEKNCLVTNSLNTECILKAEIIEK